METIDIGSLATVTEDILKEHYPSEVIPFQLSKEAILADFVDDLNVAESTKTVGDFNFWDEAFEAVVNNADTLVSYGKIIASIGSAVFAIVKLRKNKLAPEANAELNLLKEIWKKDLLAHGIKEPKANLIVDKFGYDVYYKVMSK